MSTTHTTPSGERDDWRKIDLATGLVRAAERHAERLALSASGTSLTYGELFGRAHRLATLLTEVRSPGEPLVAVMGSRTVESFVGVLATLLSGAAYVPLNPTFPTSRTELMIRASGARTLTIEAHDLEALAPSLEGIEGLAIVVTDVADPSTWSARLPDHRLYGSADVAARAEGAIASRSTNDLAYLMFTSGSTGVPKGVMVSNGNVMACLASFGERYGINCDDRFSQNFELTFDLSVFDMFLCWLHGASLHVAPPSQRTCPSAFVASAGLTIWFSVPSMGLFMQQMRVLKPGAFPSLRASLFCGERLPIAIADVWGKAAPNAFVENLYGPTEVTIACTVHRFDASADPESTQGAVPIGSALPELEAAIVDEALGKVSPGGSGELCFAGPQVALGYWNDNTRTSERFVSMPWDDAHRRWYRTGDVAAVLASGELTHLGRTDDQVKIRGYRIELGEVEFALRRALGTEAVAAIAAEGRRAGVLEIVAFIAHDFEEEGLRALLVDALPSYMHPSQLVRIDALPLTGNGKTDKNALRRILSEQHAHS